MYWGKHFYSIYSSTFGLQGIVVPLVGFASFSDSCSAAPQAMLSKKERRASEWVSERYRVQHSKLFRGYHLANTGNVNSVQAEGLQGDDAVWAASASWGAGALLSQGWKTFLGQEGIARGRVPVTSRLAIRWRQRSREWQSGSSFIPSGRG